MEGVQTEGVALIWMVPMAKFPVLSGHVMDQRPRERPAQTASDPGTRGSTKEAHMFHGICSVTRARYHAFISLKRRFVWAGPITKIFVKAFFSLFFLLCR
jgi:hypothetical protein